MTATGPAPGIRAALLVMDYQTGVVDRFPDGPRAVEATAGAVKRSRQLGVPVVWVRIAFRPGHTEVSSRNPMFSPVASSRALVDGSPEAAIHAGLQPTASEAVVTKRRVSAFSGSDLGQILSALAVDTLVLAGIATSGVVLSTIREAADRDYRLVVLADCCVDADAEVQRVLLEKVFPSQATVIVSAELGSSLGRLAGD